MNEIIKSAGIVIIGNGISGITAADSARQNNKKISITLVSNEIYPAYYRIKLCDLFSRDSEDINNIFLYPTEWYEERKINTILGKKVITMATDEKKLILDTGEELAYDKLIIASGSSSNLPDVPGNTKKGVATLWTLDDAKKIRQMIKTSSNVVISGGGLLGLEAAYQLSRKGLNVSIVERSPYLLSRQLDENGSLLFEKKVKSIGIGLYLGTSVISINGGISVEEIVFDNGDKIKSDILLFAAGVKPNTYLTSNSGIKTNRGIIVDKRMMTSNPDVYACGDVAEFEGYMPGQWISAINQGKVAGANASGADIEYKNNFPPYYLNTMEIRLYSIGDIGKKDKEYDTMEELNFGAFEYQKLYFVEGKCRGGIIMGNVKNFNIINNSIMNRLNKDEVASVLSKNIN